MLGPLETISSVPGMVGGEGSAAGYLDEAKSRGSGTGTETTVGT